MSTLNRILQKAQQYARKNPDKVGKYADKAADFANKRTKGKYSGQIDGAKRKLDSFTGDSRSQDPRDGTDPRHDDRGPQGGNPQQ